MNTLFGRTQQPQQGMNAAQIIAMVKNSGKTPEQFVKNMISSGQLSQKDFENYRAIANRTLGTNL